MAKFKAGARRAARRRRLLRGMIPLVVGLTSSACSDQVNTHGAQPEGASLVGAPVIEGPSTKDALPPLSAELPNVEAGHMTTWVELLDPPTPLNDAWVSGALGDLFVTPAGLAPQLRAAKKEVERRAEEARVEVPAFITEITSLFRSYTPESGENKLVGYKPERARWLSERSVNGSVETFPDPYAFAEMRQRGARLYCAATAAYNHRTRANRVMGKTMAAGINVLGLPLDLMVIEPTIAMGKPMRFDSGKNDGGQAFVLPFEAGVRARPVSFLFGLPELNVPVGFLSADSESASKSNLNGGSYDKWITMSHMDGFASVSQPYLKSETPDIDFLRLGPLTFSAKLGMDMGTAACSQAASYEDCRKNTFANPGRLIGSTHEGTGPVTAWPARPGGWTIKGVEGPWAYNNGPWDVDVVNWFAIPKGSKEFWIPTLLPDPLVGRMLQNNDKSMEVHTSSGGTLSLVVSGGVKTEWFELAAQGTGSIRAGVNTVHRFREQEEMLVLPPPDLGPEVEFNGPVPAMVTSFTVTPASATDFTFGIGIGVKFAIHLGFLDRDFTREIAKTSKTLSTGLEEWPETRRLRMDTAISDGKNANFNVISHMPRDATYWTYEAIDACQAPQTQVVKSDPPCAPANRDKPTPDKFQPIQANLCLWREEYSLEPDNFASLENDCWNAMKPWLESGTSKRQRWHEANYYVVARAIQWDNAQDMEALHGALARCDTLYGQAGRSAEFGDLLHFSFCDGSATLHDNLIEPMIPAEVSTPGYGANSDPDSCD